MFHPTRSIVFISTKKTVRVYDLREQKLIKKLETGLREVSSIAVHPGGMFSIFFFFFAYFIVGMNVNVIRLVFHFLEYKQLLVSVIFAIYLRCAFCAGDNVIVGSREGKLCWFDMDLSSQPYRILKYVTAP